MIPKKIRQFFCILVCVCLWCTTNAQQKSSIRIASWNLEEFNAYKAQLQPYIDYTNKYIHTPPMEKDGEKVKSPPTPVQVINEFLTANSVDILFIQEWIPFSFWPVDNDKDAKFQLDFFNELKNLNPAYSLKPLCYYDGDYLKRLSEYNVNQVPLMVLPNPYKTWKDFLGGHPELLDTHNQADLTGHNIPANPLYNSIPRCGECYVVIYRSKNSDGRLFLSQDAILFEKNFDSYKGKKNSNWVRPPMYFSLKLKSSEDAAFRVNEAKRIGIFNYHGEKDGNFSLADVRSFSIENGQKPVLDPLYKEPVIFLGDLNSKDPLGKKAGPQIATDPVDHILFNKVLENSMSKVIPITSPKKANSKPYTSSLFFERPFKMQFPEGSTTVSTSSSRFSDHNPIYADLSIGGNLSIYEEIVGIQMRGSVNESNPVQQGRKEIYLCPAEFANTPSPGGFFCDVEIRCSLCERTFKADSLQSQPSPRIHWVVDVEKVKAAFQGGNSHEGMHKCTLTFFYAEKLWSITKTFDIANPILKAASAPNEAMLRVSDNPDPVTSGIRLKNVETKGESVFQEKKGSHCELRGDNILIKGTGFSREDITLELSNGKKFSVAAKEIDEKGSFSKRIGNADEHGVSEYEMEAVAGDRKAASTRFRIIPCESDKDRENKDRVADVPGTFCRLLAKASGTAKDFVNMVSTSGNFVDMVKLAQGDGCVKGIENLFKVAVTVGLEYYTRGTAIAGKTGASFAKGFMPVFGKLATSGLVAKLMAGVPVNAGFSINVEGKNGKYLSWEGDVQKCKDYLARTLSAEHIPVVFVASVAEGSMVSQHILYDKTTISAQQINEVLDQQQEPKDINAFLLRTSGHRQALTNIDPGKSYIPGDFFYDESSGMILIFQKDYNVVLYKSTGNGTGWLPVWSSGTHTLDNSVYKNFSIKSDGIAISEYWSQKASWSASFGRKANGKMDLSLTQQGFTIKEAGSGEVLFTREAGSSGTQVSASALRAENGLHLLESNRSKRIDDLTSNMYAGYFFYDPTSRLLFNLQCNGNYVVCRLEEDSYHLTVIGSTLKKGELADPFAAIDSSGFPKWMASFGTYYNGYGTGNEIKIMQKDANGGYNYTTGGIAEIDVLCTEKFCGNCTEIQSGAKRLCMDFSQTILFRVGKPTTNFGADKFTERITLAELISMNRWFY